MTTGFTVTGISTGLIVPGDDMASRILSVHPDFEENDIVVVAESALATAEGQIVALDTVDPTDEAGRLAARYAMDPHLVQVVLEESDRVVGGIPGFLLCMKDQTLLPNAGVDGSNAPPGTVILLPKDPSRSARRIREEIERRTGARVGVVIADSRTHAMRLGCSGVALGCSGLRSVIDERGRPDLFDRPLEITKRAVADCIASAAELVMGESDECIPVAVVRGLVLPRDGEEGIGGIDPSECLFMGVALDANPSLGDREGEP